MMDREEFVNNKFITVAGRAASMEEFAAFLKKNLFDNFGIVAIHGLGEFGIDDKERYLAFITGDSKSGQTFNAQREKLLEAELGAHTHNNLDDAYEYSKNNYPTFGEEEEQMQRKYEELKEKFPPVKASEIEQFDIFEALLLNNKIKTVRALFNDVPCITFISVSGGVDELRVRPLAIMLNEDLEALIEFPDPEEV